MTAERVVKNQRLFRQINLRIRGIHWAEWAGDQGEPMDFLCECGGRDCIETVELTLEEFDQIAARPNTVLTAFAHEAQGVPVGSTERFCVFAVDAQ